MTGDRPSFDASREAGRSVSASHRRRNLWWVLALAALLPACDRDPTPAPPPTPAPAPPAPPVRAADLGAIPANIPGGELARTGDEILVAGRLFHTGTRVVLFTEPGGYDGYRTERRFAPWSESAFAEPVIVKNKLVYPKGQPDRPARYGTRDSVLTWPELEAVRGGGWPLELLQQKIDQFVLHFDAVGTSQFCFQTLQDQRGLSIHFMLDIDGTIYQTLDVKERAFHATTSNPRSIGIEIANRGAYESEVPLREFYTKDLKGFRISLPARFKDGGLRVPGVYRPDRPAAPIRGSVNGLNLVQHDFTPEQYAALARLTAALCTVLPKIKIDYPRDSAGEMTPNKLPDAKLATYQGLLAHSNVQDNKYDPGPAFQWDRLVKDARGLMTAEALEANRKAQGRSVGLTSLATQPSRPVKE